jgi:dATP pyrophosphohydrolase
MAKIAANVVEVCIFKLERGEPRYLLLRRAERDSLYPGIWQLVSGMVEEQEHTVRAALRELHEETGLRPIRFWAAPFVDLFYLTASDTVHLSPLFAAQVREQDQPTLSSEHQAFSWDDIETAYGKLIWPGQRRGLRRVHRYIVGGLAAGDLREITDFAQYERNS